MAHFTKIVRLGTKKTPDGHGYSVYCKVVYRPQRDNILRSELSITGVEGPLPGGNCLGGCGQICMSMDVEEFNTFAPGWNRAKVRRFLEVWDHWHLNGTQAGTPAQNALAKEFYKTAKYPDADYTNCCAYLESKGMLYDAHPVTGEPYKYGTAWLHEAVPDAVLEWLMALPDADREPAWV